MQNDSKVIVITGSTRGIGFGMATEFLKLGHRVAVGGRGTDSTQQAAQKLSAQFGSDLVLGQACDVSDYGQVQTLWDAAAKRFGRVDVWINNAGLSNKRVPIWELSNDEIQTLVNTNLMGVVYGSKVAVLGMLKQGFGQIYNMEGLGSNHKMVTAGLILYGATKSAVAYFTDGLVLETKDTPVQVSFLSPGMVVTDLLIGESSGEEEERTSRIFNILADRVETVAPFLVENILKNDKHGSRIAWLTTPKIAWRFMSAPFNKRDVLTPTQ